MTPAVLAQLPLDPVEVARPPVVGAGGPALGGRFTLLGLHLPGPALIAMALPLLVFAAARALRDRRVFR